MIYKYIYTYTIYIDVKAKNRGEQRAFRTSKPHIDSRGSVDGWMDSFHQQKLLKWDGMQWVPSRELVHIPSYPVQTGKGKSPSRVPCLVKGCVSSQEGKIVYNNLPLKQTIGLL